ncbi:MAG TPA: HAD-IIA family hydrolase [Actinomycetota bacterium]|nr:HAD-IIA family hydrolase [Actinomycetota bacterium]
MRPADAYDAFLLDLDGVLFRGTEAIPGAADAVAALRRRGRVVFLTNNSARTPAQVAEKLRGMGFEAAPEDVMTSALAAARLVADEVRADGRDATAFVIGEDGIRTALRDAGVEVVDGDPERAGFVVVAWDRGATYDRIRTASVLARAGARLVATNADATYPAPGGELWPGAGALLASVETASGSRATVVGKPEPGLFEAAVERAGTRRALVVGDRVETDLAGARAVGLDAALVFSGAAVPADLLDVDVEPVAAMADLRGLLDDAPLGPARPGRPEQRDAVRALLDRSGLDPGEAAGDLTGTAVLGDPPAATATVEVRDGQGYLRSVAVDREVRGRFRGVLVVASAVRRAVGAGAGTVYLLTETAAGFFERLGFVPMERPELPAWIRERSTACPESAVAMRRPVRR